MSETEVKEGRTASHLTIFTIGHSDHTPDDFLALLKRHAIQAVADGSRRE